MLRLRFNFLIILIIIFSYAVEQLTILEEEVVDTSQFTEYYSFDEGENQGEQILSSNYFVYQREYIMNSKGELVRKSQEEGIEIVEETQTEEGIVINVTEYTVQKGDTLAGIAKNLKMSEEILKINNPKNKKIVKVGDKLRIPSENGIFYKVKKGDSLFKIAQKYKVKIEELRKYNKMDNDSLTIGNEIFIKDPDLKVIKSELIVVREKKVVVPIGKEVEGFIMPIKYQGVNSPYGNRFHPVLRRYIMHAGVDLKANYIPFKAADGGVVTYAGYMSGYGKIIIVKHDNGYETRYAHIQEAWVKKGEKIAQGQVIGKSGNSGRSTGPHLHFEIRKGGRTIDPMRNVIRE